jgi:hypothetical protein
MGMTNYSLIVRVKGAESTPLQDFAGLGEAMVMGMANYSLIVRVKGAESAPLRDFLLDRPLSPL